MDSLHFRLRPILRVDDHGLDARRSVRLLFGYVVNWNTNGNVIITDPNGISYTEPQAGYQGSSQTLMPGFNQVSTYDFASGNTQIPIVPSLVEDSNGNEISYGQCNGAAGWTDTMSRCIPAPVADTPSASDPYPCPTVSGQPAASESWYWDLPSLPGGPTNGTYRIKFCAVSISESFSYYYAPGSQDIDWQETAVDMQSIVLPNGTAWQFLYDDSSRTGNLTQIIFPIGGTLSYDWTAGPRVCGTAYQCIGSVLTDSSGTQRALTYYYYDQSPDPSCVCGNPYSV